MLLKNLNQSFTQSYMVEALKDTYNTLIYTKSIIMVDQ